MLLPWEHPFFDFCPNLTIYGEADSIAEFYAKKNNIPFKPLSEFPGESALKIGDPTGDGTITSQDAVFVLRSAAGLETLDDDLRTACDVNGDGSVNSADAVSILRYIAGLKDEGILIE